jgi:hypothetical protein
MGSAPPDSGLDLYGRLGFSRDELRDVMRLVWDELIAFVTSPSFSAVVAELMALPRAERPGYVERVLLRPEELARRGVETPEGILIQTSSFGDRRPTLFVVKKFLPAMYHGAWENLNITYDNEYADDEVTRDPEAAWRRPLDVALQNAALAGDIDLESLGPMD